ncbi:MAG: hypothetical protein DMG14_15295 [Acidobacteria bacterium]|nr:MAG: hypothetical protein DMG14_15295 [Acidobacteriota bacterium]
MPVRKYRSLEDMNRENRWLPTGDSSILQKIRYLWRFSELLLRPVGTCIPRGIRKYRSIEEANADRDRWEKERVDRFVVERKRL